MDGVSRGSINGADTFKFTSKYSHDTLEIYGFSNEYGAVGAVVDGLSIAVQGPRGAGKGHFAMTRQQAEELVEFLKAQLEAGDFAAW